MPESQNNPTEIGVITGLTGEAFAESASGLRTLEPGSPIYQGEELVTESGGNVEVRFIDDTLLSQGENSRIALDDYVFDPDDSSNSELMLDIAQGTFRVVTGKIAENNPERFKIGSPLATMGIRGTITIHEVGPDGEKHGVEEIHSGKALIVQSNITGAIRQIGQPMGLVDVTRSGALSQVRPLSQQEFNTFRKIAPENIRHEQEIRNEREDQDRRDDDDQNDEQNDEQQDRGQPEGQQDELPADVAPGGGDPAEGDGNPGSVLFPKGGVVEPGKETLVNQEELTGHRIHEPPKIGEKTEPEEPEKSDPEQQKKPNQQDPQAQQTNKDKDDDPDLEKDQSKPSEESESETGNTQNSSDTDSGSGSESGSSNPEDQHPELNQVRGVAGDSNVLEGTADADNIVGQELADQLYGKADDDFLYGKEGNDTLNGGPGNDYLDGGAGEIDFASYADATSGVSATLTGSTGTAECSEGNDTLVNIEGLIGSNYADTLIGDDGENVFKPLLSTDFVADFPTLNRDYVDGKDGKDWIQFDTLSKSLYLDLNTNSAVIHDGTDLTGTEISALHIYNIENVVGTDVDDFIRGDGEDNILMGGDGNDTLKGEGGIDTISYEGSETGIKVDLSTGSGQVYHGSDVDKFYNIEAIIGSNVADTITSSCTQNDTIQGGGGNDLITLTLATGKENTLKYTALSDGGDTITNFIHGEDKLYFSGNDFDSSAGDNLVTMSGTYDGTTGPANSDACFIFDDTSGKLWYDSNGNEAGGEELMATLSGVTDLSDSDISVA